MKALAIGAAVVLTTGAAVAVSTLAPKFRRSAHAAGSTTSVAPRPPPNVRADGIVVARPGAHVTVSTEVGGTIAKLHVQRGTSVVKGQLLVEFKRGEQLAALQASWARADEARTQLRAKIDREKRTTNLVDGGALPPTELLDAKWDARAARARYSAEGADAQRLAAILERSKIVAPISGTVIACSIEAGETLAPGAMVLEIADTTHLRVQAEVDEYFLGQVGMGARASVTTEALPNQKWDGTVEELGDAVVPRRLRPDDPARPRDVGVLPVWLSLPGDHPLKLGQRVEVGIAPKQ